MDPIIRGTKKMMERQLIDVVVSKAIIAKREKDWEILKKKLQDVAMILIRELHRKGGDSSNPTASTVFHFKETETGYDFYFETPICFVKLSFERDDYGKQTLSDVSHEVFEQALVLF